MPAVGRGARGFVEILLQDRPTRLRRWADRITTRTDLSKTLGHGADPDRNPFPDITGRDTSSVTDTRNMFETYIRFNRGIG